MYLNILWLFIGHLAIDLTSAWVFFTAIKTADVFLLVVVYNILAFGTQFLFGLLVDKIKNPRRFCYFGLILALIGSSLLLFFPIIALIIIGLANAIFHVGIGVTTLNLNPHKAKIIGIVISSGAIGILIGKLMTAYYFSFYLIAALLLALIVSLLFLKRSKTPLYQEPKIDYPMKPIFLTLIFVFIAIVIRSFVGSGLSFSWDSGTLVYLALIFVFLGKFLGGFLADHFGWAGTVFISLILSAALLFIGKDTNWLSLFFLLLFNIPMSVTMLALAEIVPRRPGLAFGLNCLALFFGFSLFYFELLSPQFWLIIILILLAATFTTLALLKINKLKKYD